MGPVPGFAFGAEKLVGIGAGPGHTGRGVTVPAPRRGCWRIAGAGGYKCTLDPVEGRTRHPISMSFSSPFTFDRPPS